MLCMLLLLVVIGLGVVVWLQGRDAPPASASGQGPTRNGTSDEGLTPAEMQLKPEASAKRASAEPKRSAAKKAAAPVAETSSRDNSKIGADDLKGGEDELKGLLDDLNLLGDDTATPSGAPILPASTEADAAPSRAAANDARAAERAALHLPAPRYAARGAYVAQLAAVRREANAERTWRRLSARAPRLLEDSELDITRVTLEDGVYFRVRAGYFADRTNARRFCDRMKMIQQACMPMRR